MPTRRTLSASSQRRVPPPARFTARAVLYQHPGVIEAAVFGIPDERWGEAVHAVVTLKAGIVVTTEELNGFVRERIASYKAPRSLEIRTGLLPKSGAGKILKRDLRAPYWETSTRQVN